MEYKSAYLSGPYDLELKEVKVPKIAKDQVLVKVKAAAICGSDVECYSGKSKEGRYDIAPYVPGHEWSGEVSDVGEDTLELRKGDKVVADVNLTCGVCDNCKDGLSTAFCRNLGEIGFMPDAPGGMGEFMVVKEGVLHKLPEEMSYEEGALVEPCSIAYHGIWGNGGHVDANDDVVIFGAGPIGLFAAAVAKSSGAKVIMIDPIELRREMARKIIGVDEVINPGGSDLNKSVLSLTAGRGASLILECSGSDEAIASTVEVARHGGRVHFIGHSIGRRVPIEIGLTIWKGLSLHGMCGAPNFLPKTIKFMVRTNKRIDYTRIITHKFPLDRLQDAFTLAEQKKDEAVKVMLIM